MLTYSVWDPQARRYDYYRALGNVRSRMAATNGSRVAADDAVPVLPAGAQWVGRGDQAIGEVTQTEGGMGITKLIVIGLIMYGLIRAATGGF